jgi:hypothetical protein
MSHGLRDLDGVRVELCDECGFDGREPRHLATALAEAYRSIERLSDHPDAGQRPEPETWSATEYAEHCVEVTANIVAICARAAHRPESAHLAPPAGATTAAAEFINELSDAQWAAVTDGWPFELSVREAITHLLHDLEHHVWDIRRGYARIALAKRHRNRDQPLTAAIRRKR